MIAHQSLLSPFPDVLCPSVRVEGDRFKHANGGAKEITGTRNRRPAQLALQCHLPDVNLPWWLRL